MLVWTEFMKGRTRALLAIAIMLATQGAWAAPAAPTLNAPSVAGPQVTLRWSAVAGALGYRLSIGTAPNTEAYAQVVGATTTVTFNSPFVGTGYVRVQAYDATGLSPASNEVALTVTTMTPVPAAPVGLQAFLSGRSVNLSWGPGAGGGTPQSVILDPDIHPRRQPRDLLCPRLRGKRQRAQLAVERSAHRHARRGRMHGATGVGALLVSERDHGVVCVDSCRGRRRIPPGGGNGAQRAGARVTGVRGRNDGHFLSERASGNFL